MVLVESLFAALIASVVCGLPGLGLIALVVALRKRQMQDEWERRHR